MKNRRTLFMQRLVMLAATLLLTVLNPYTNFAKADTTTTETIDPNDPNAINISPFYNVTDPTLRDKLIDDLNHRTVPTTDGSLRDNAPVVVIAHRGVVDADHPENTLESAVNTMNAGVEGMELDIYETQDEVPYLMHDQTLKRMLNRPEYSDIYRWQREGSPAGQMTPTWSDIQNTPICYNGVDGYGKTVEHPVCDDVNMRPASLDDVLHQLYDNSYQGLIFLDLRSTENVRDVAAELLHAYTTSSVGGYGDWVVDHVVFKFATTYFNGPADYSSKVLSRYGSKYGSNPSEQTLSVLQVLPVYFPNTATARDGGGATSWAINDFNAWVSWYTNKNNSERLLPPEVEIKSTGSILNYGADDLFTTAWQSGRSVGVYVPKNLCTFNPSSQIPEPANYLGGNSGTWWEGGVCGPLAPTMNSNECGSSGWTAITESGGGCTDHRFLKAFWHDTSKFGFIITDTPVEDINYLAQFPGQRWKFNFVNLAGTGPVIKVAQDGTGNYATIAAAIAAAPDNGATIQVAPGIYNEKLLIAKPNVTLVGMGADASKVKITNNDYAAKINPATGNPYGTTGSATVTVTGKDFYATNLTIANTADYEAPGYEANAQAVALLTKGDRAVYRAVMILGGQDTLYVNSTKRAYFNNCYVEGYVDFIFGNGKAVFDNCTIKAKVHANLIGEVTITAQSRETAGEDSGFVFNDNTILFDDPDMNNVWLGRPWSSYSTVYFLHTMMGPQLTDKGWIEFVPAEYAPPGQATNNLPTSTYREYQTAYRDSNGGWYPFDISKRETVSANANVSLTDAEAAALAADTYLKGADNWKPTAVTYGENTNQQLSLPTLSIGVPGAPTIYSVIAGNQNLQVTWAGKPANPQTSSYRLWAVQNGVTYGPIEVPRTASSAYIGGLTNGVPAQIYVAGVNAQGMGQAAASDSVTPVSDAPSVPGNFSFQQSSGSVTMTFTVADQGSQPVVGGSVPNAGVYVALYASQNDAYAGKAIAGTSTGFGPWNYTTSGSGFTTNYTFNNLQPNTTYWMSLWAYNGKSSPTAITSFTTSP